MTDATTAACCGPTCLRGTPQTGECVASTYGAAILARQRAAGYAAAPAGAAYVSQTQADAESLRLDVGAFRGIVPALILHMVEGVVANRRSTSDTLLIIADQLREVAKPFNASPMAQGLRQLADTLADIAPARANLLQDSTP
jgi:hypothetical protein